MTTYVLIPGACHGAWCFDELAAALRSHGHRVLAYTLTGIAERAHLLHAGVNLQTHLTDVLSALAVDSDADDRLYGELSRVNNELINAQRELVQRNVRLERAEAGDAIRQHMADLTIKTASSTGSAANSG